MKKLVMCLIVCVALAGVACAGDVPNGQGSGNAVGGAVTTAYNAAQTGCAAVGGSIRVPLQVAKDAINSFCKGLSDGDTFFWD